MVSTTIERLPAVKARSGLSRSLIYKLITEGLWTKPVQLARRCVGWPASEVDAINAARVAGKPEQDIKVLVRQLHSTRTKEIV